jgi:hypothetical protein
MSKPDDEGPAEWTAELESAGQVVFPQRRRRVLVRMAIFGLLAADSLWSLISDVRDGKMVGVWAVLRVTSTTMFLVAAGFTVWQLVTRRPVVTVGRDGITVGRRKDRGSLTWAQIGGIGDPTGIRGIRQVQVLPADRWASGLGVSQDNVKHVNEFAGWFRSIFEQRRRREAADS